MKKEIKTKQFPLVPVSGTRNKVFVELNKEEKVSSGGIILVDTEPKRTEGTVIAVSEKDDSGQLPNVQIGDYVFFPAYTATIMNYEGEEYLVIKESDIQAKLNK